MSLRRALAPLTLGIAPALASGCGSEGGRWSSGEVGTYVPDAAGSFVGADGSVPDVLTAQIEQGHLAVTLVTVSCAGSCAEVEAVPSGGHPPYSFAWSDGSTSALREVCPTSSTRYSVDVTDTALVGEVAQAPQTARASVTARVLACPEGGAPDAANGAGTDACVAGIENPSFEGTPQATNLFPWDAVGWQKCGGAPSQLTNGGAPLPSPTDGQTYLLIQPPDLPPAGAGQQLCSPLAGGASMSFTIDLAIYSPNPPTAAQKLQIYGGDTACCGVAACAGSAPLLWTSPALTSAWSTYCVTLRPAQSTASLTFEAAAPATAGGAQDILLDHIVPVAGCP